jgi:hypothetical protein
VRSGGGKWIRKVVGSPFLALGAPGVGVRAMNILTLLLSTRVIVPSDARK